MKQLYKKGYLALTLTHARTRMCCNWSRSVTRMRGGSLVFLVSADARKYLLILTSVSVPRYFMGIPGTYRPGVNPPRTSRVPVLSWELHIHPTVIQVPPAWTRTSKERLWSRFESNLGLLQSSLPHNLGNNCFERLPKHGSAQRELITVISINLRFEPGLCGWRTIQLWPLYRAGCNTEQTLSSGGNPLSVFKYLENEFFTIF